MRTVARQQLLQIVEVRLRILLVPRRDKRPPAPARRERGHIRRALQDISGLQRGDAQSTPAQRLLAQPPCRPPLQDCAELRFYRLKTCPYFFLSRDRMPSSPASSQAITSQ